MDGAAISAPSNVDRYLHVRSMIETPIMDDRKWAKVPGIAADAFLVDLEDSVPPPLKEAARERVIDCIRDPSHLGGRTLVARPNHLSTPWGRDDIEAMAEAGVTCLAYPKCESADDLGEMLSIFRAHGGSPDVFATVETARAVVNMREVASNPNVVALGIGVGDLSADMGVPLFDDDGEVNPLFDSAKSQLTIMGAAFGLLRCDFAYAPDLRDLAEVQRRLLISRARGFTAAATFYPPHVDVINEVFSPSPAEVQAADDLIGVYEAAVADGRAALADASGRTILVHDYHKALKVRARAAALAR